MFSIFDEINYSDIMSNMELLKDEVEYLDDDSLIEEVAHLQYKIEGKEADKIIYLEAKNYNEEEFTEEEREFLINVHLTYSTSYVISILEEEDCYAALIPVEDYEDE